MTTFLVATLTGIVGLGLGLALADVPLLFDAAHHRGRVAEARAQHRGRVVAVNLTESNDAVALVLYALGVDMPAAGPITSDRARLAATRLLESAYKADMVGLVYDQVRESWPATTPAEARAEVTRLRDQRDKARAQIDDARNEAGPLRAREKRVRDLLHWWRTRGDTAAHDQRAEELARALDSDGRPAVQSSVQEAEAHDLICQAVDAWADGELTAEAAMEAVHEQVGDR